MNDLFIKGPGNTQQASTGETAQLEAFKQLVRIERAAREAENLNAFQYVVVNETYGLVRYQQALLVKLHKDNSSAEIRATSGNSRVDRNSPAIRWLEHIVSDLDKEKQLESIRPIERDDINESYQSDFDNFLAPYVLWCPLKLPSGNKLGGLLFTRETAWTESEHTVLQQLADSFAFAWSNFEKPGNFERKRSWRKNAAIFTFALLGLAMFLPVPLSVLAPAEVVASEFSIVAAPMGGVIKEVVVKPNARVNEGDVLFHFDDVELRGKYAVATEQYAVAESEYSKYAQKAVQDLESREQLAILKATLAQKKAEQTFTSELLERLDVRAPRDGVVVINDVEEWRGKPVVAGERVLKVANPDKVELKIFLPVADAIIVEEGAPIRLFLDTAPLEPLSAELVRANYEAEKTADNQFAFRLTADFTETDKILPRIGMRGTARISGQDVSLFFYLFRRPISALRQFVGI